MSTNPIRIGGTALLAGTIAVGLAACGSDGTGATDGADREITLGVIRAWSDTELAAGLMEHAAGQLGYTVEYEELTEVPLLYSAVAEGTVDVYPSAWAERNHVGYIEPHGDKLEDLGAYTTGAISFLAVPGDSELESIEDLHDHWDEVGGRIVGIEPGSGLTTQMIEDVLPAYGFEASDLVTSSTPAMLAEISGAIDAGEDVVVTLWTPFWPMTQFDVKPLEDPLGAFGEPEGLHYVATQGFADAHPELARWVEELDLDEQQFGTLENLIVNEYEDGEELAAVEEWLESNPDVLPELPES